MKKKNHFAQSKAPLFAARTKVSNWQCKRRKQKGVKSHERVCVPVIACVEDKSRRWLGRGEGPDCLWGKRDEEEKEEMGNGSMLC
ncbi:hypothetical protein V6N12_005095 [Hibiscus sabdariffa]|uniref:Uncharacterized protein n=1 Tax=Hibiscus sabdariffa TaxID=183260 RepID=A0ABR2CNR9_9ROSI